MLEVFYCGIISSMPYYSKKVLYFFTVVYSIAIFLALIYWFAAGQVACWATNSSSECFYQEVMMNLYFGIIPMFFLIASGLVLFLQQKGYARAGYFMIFLFLIPFLYVSYYLQYVSLWPDFFSNFFQIFHDFYSFGVGIYLVAIYGIILITILNPLYVLKKLLIYEIKGK
jgi:hypothetical protein